MAISAGKRVVQVNCTIILNERRVDSKRGEIMADRTTKYMMLRRSPASTACSHNAKQVDVEVTSQGSRIAEFLMDSRMLVRSEEDVEESGDQCYGSIEVHPDRRRFAGA